MVRAASVTSRSMVWKPSEMVTSGRLVKKIAWEMTTVYQAP